MSGFDATPVDLQVCGSMLTATSEDMRTELHHLRGEMDTLLGSWQGPAAKGFAAGWEEWQRGAGDVLTALHTMGGLLSETGVNYQTVDTASADDLNQSGSAL